MNLQHITNKVGKSVFVALVLFGVSMVFSDINAPFTTNAYLKKDIISVTTGAEGNVSEIFVKNGDYIKKGDPIFAIDEHDLVENKDIAYANMVVIQQHLTRLKIEIKQATQQVDQQQEIVDNTRTHYQRFKALLTKGTISQEMFDDAHLAYLDAEKELKKDKLELESKTIQLAEEGENGGLMLAQALVNRADRKISKAITFASVSGWVTNLQLNVGEFINNRNPQVAITLDHNANLVANFNEKALGRLEGATVMVVFDALPGEIFTGTIKSKDSAVQVNQRNDNDLGKEAFVQRDERWIRKSQQVRTIIEVEDLPTELISGSKATTMIKPEGSGFWSLFSVTVMKFVSLFRYIY